jgi:hypothetical protein
MMKTLSLILALIFSVMFSSTSFAGWKKVTEDAHATYYVDFEGIRKVDGFVYFWYLRDLLKPDKWGSLSGKSYDQGDCKLFRFKNLSGSFHKEPMGGGTPSSSGTFKNPQWVYPPPKSVIGTILKSVCAYAK